MRDRSKAGGATLLFILVVDVPRSYSIALAPPLPHSSSFNVLLKQRSPGIMTQGTSSTTLLPHSSKQYHHSVVLMALHEGDGYDACHDDLSSDNGDNNYNAANAASTPLHNNSSSGSNNTNNTATNTQISKQILNLAIPALISLSIDPLMTIADTAFVGRYAAPNDPYPLAGLGSAASLLVFSFYIFNFLATSTSPLVAGKRATGDESGACQVGGQALSLSIVLGTILMIILLVYRSPLLQLMGTSITGAYTYADQFLMVRALAAPAVLLCSASNGILRGYLDTRTPTIILLISNLINLVLDVILVANMRLGPLGAGIATTVAEWIAAFCFLGVLSGKLPTLSDGTMNITRRRRYDALDNQQQYNKIDNGDEEEEVLLTVITPLLELPSWVDVRPLVIASSSVFLRSIVLQVAMSSAAAMAARSSTPIDEMMNAVVITSGGAASASVAAHQVALQLWLLCSFLCDALATASQCLVADGIGRRDATSVRIVSQTVFNWGLALGLTLSLCLYAGKESGLLIDFFTSDATTRIELRKLLTIVIFAQPLNSFVFAADGVLQGAGEFTYQAKSMVVSVFCAFIMFAIIEYTSFGQEVLTGNDNDTLVHVWYALITLQTMRGITSLIKVVDKTGPIDLFGKLIT
jgi:Na+-driven multidrug efflux pump